MVAKGKERVKRQPGRLQVLFWLQGQLAQRAVPRRQPQAQKISRNREACECAVMIKRQLVSNRDQSALGSMWPEHESSISPTQSARAARHIFKVAAPAGSARNNTPTQRRSNDSTSKNTSKPETCAPELANMMNDQYATGSTSHISITPGKIRSVPCRQRNPATAPR